MNKQTKSFLVAFITIALLMVFTYVMSLICDCDGISLVKFILSPILVLGSDSSVTLIAIIVFLFIIGGISNALNKCGFMENMLNGIVHRYAKARYKLIAILVFFFMAMGSLIGSFEEVVPLVPIAVLLAKQLGFDDLTGIGISLLAIDCGFAAGIANPFTIGVAQGLADLPLFSGISLRLLSFILIYVLLMSFLVIHTKRLEKSTYSLEDKYFYDSQKEKALKAFVIIMSIGLILVLSSSVLTLLQDYTIIIIALSFLIAGITACKICNTSNKEFIKYFKDGSKDILPSLVLILMASSIKYTIDTAGLMDVILKNVISFASQMNKYQLIIFVYTICLVLEAFIPSGSAKAFLLIPLLMPIADMYGISRQLCIVAYAFGDGFSNVLYPTNPALLISLGLADVSYSDWFKYSWKFQALNFLLTSGILIFGMAIGY